MIIAPRTASAATPVYHIIQIGRLWQVQRPGSEIEHAFDELDSAIDFVRHDCPEAEATIEVLMEDFYVVKHLVDLRGGARR